MDMKDRVQLSQWLAGHATLAEVEHAGAIGLVGNIRFTEQARRAYVFLWNWSAPRFSGSIGARQDRIYAQHGAQALARRFARVNRIIARIIGGDK